MQNKKIVLAGGTGFIGQALAARWGKENQVIVLRRQSASEHNNRYDRKLLTAADGYHITYWHWDGQQVERHWAEAVENCDLVVNLAGRSVNCRYTARNRKEIFDSRLDATRAIGEAIRGAVVPPKLWVNAASATIYRHAEDRPQDEYTGETGQGSVARSRWSTADDFSIQVCKRWEEVFFAQRTPFTRKIAIRTAITLGEGGAMVPYLRLTRWGLGGRQGNGRQMFSWVHIDDLARAIEWLFTKPELEGAYNVAAPGPVTNACFMSTLRRLMNIRIGLPAPAWFLKLGAFLIGTETELVLKSRWVLPTKLQEAGFRFRYERIEQALGDIVYGSNKKRG